ncbi:peptidase M16 inactive domain protein, partial [Vibrio parahaemolyticus IDH02189]
WYTLMSRITSVQLVKKLVSRALRTSLNI